MISDLVAGKATLAFATPLGSLLVGVAATAALLLVVAGVRRAPWATVLRCGALLLLLLSLAGLSVETREAAQNLCLIVSEDLSAGQSGAASSMPEASLVAFGSSLTRAALKGRGGADGQATTSP